MSAKLPHIFLFTPALLASVLTMGEIVTAQEIATNRNSTNLNNNNFPVLITKLTEKNTPESNAQALIPVISVGRDTPTSTNPIPENVLLNNNFANYQLDEFNWNTASQNLPNYTTNPFPSNELTRNPFLVADNLPQSANLWSSARPDGHAPLGVMGDHTHGKGEVMVSYRYMLMDMDGNRDGTDSISNAEVLEDFPVTPTNMTMEMHMLGIMYAPSDNLTLMTMIPYVFKDMDHVTRMGVEFTTESEGFGDIQLGGLYKILDRNNQRVHLNLGLSFPTGSIDERGDTPTADNAVLPYPMQIGSGTFDLRPGITYLGQSNDWSWGAQANSVLRLGDNGEDYQLGNEFGLTAWGAYRWNEWFSTSVRLNGRTWGDIEGADSRLNPNLIPTADPDLRNGTNLFLGLGVNFYIPKGSLKGSRIAVELEFPLLRDLDGPQLETDLQLTAGLQFVL